MNAVNVSSISLPGLGSEPGRLEKVLDRASNWIDIASKDEPDIICLPESLNALGLSGRVWAECAEPLTGPTTQMISSKAAEYSTYIVCPIVRRHQGCLHNSAVLCDRSGEIAALYDKVHPTISEMEVGIVPGKQGVAYDADFGRLGFAICFDLNFRDLRDFYRRVKPRIILFPSMFRGGIQLRLWAFEIGCYVISATPGEQSSIIDPLGRILEESSEYERIVSRRINLDFTLLHLDYNHEKLKVVKEAYGKAVRFEVASPQGLFLMFSDHPSTTAGQMIDEFGLETRESYFRRAETIRRLTLGRALTRSD